MTAGALLFLYLLPSALPQVRSALAQPITTSRKQGIWFPLSPNTVPGLLAETAQGGDFS